VYSGIGGSIGLSRLMELILEKANTYDTEDTYLFVHMEDTFDAILAVYMKFLSA
jgi:hypothetical protein